MEESWPGTQKALGSIPSIRKVREPNVWQDIISHNTCSEYLKQLESNVSRHHKTQPLLWTNKNCYSLFLFAFLSCFPFSFCFCFGVGSNPMLIKVTSNPSLPPLPTGWDYRHSPPQASSSPPLFSYIFETGSHSIAQADLELTI